MSRPPEDVSASELFAKFLQKPAPDEVVDFPVDGFPRVRVVLQTDEVHTLCQIRGREIVEARLQKDQRDRWDIEAMVGDAAAREIIAHAFQTEKPIPGSEGDNPRYARIFADGAQVSKLPALVVGTLFGLYLLVQRKYGPGEHDFESDDEVNAWIERIAEGAGRHAFLALDSYQQVALLDSLTERSLLLSELINSTPEELPERLESLRARFSLGTGSSGREPTDSVDESSDIDNDLPGKGETITTEKAFELAQKIRGNR